MTYRIEGLDPATFVHLYGSNEATLAQHRARRVVADNDRGFPCRVTLRDAPVGTSLLLVHHLSHDAETPYRSAFAIYVPDGEAERALYLDEVPPVFAGRTLTLRGFDADGMLQHAVLAEPGDTDKALRTMFGHVEVAYIDVHNAAPGCFAARATRDAA